MARPKKNIEEGNMHEESNISVEVKDPETFRDEDDHLKSLSGEDFCPKLVGVALEKKIEAMAQRDKELVTGKFINRRAPGQTVKLTYAKHKGDLDKWYTFQDGKTYTIPRGFADQLNEAYYTPKFVQKPGELTAEGGSVIQEVDTSNKRYAFVATTF